jgi:hypothetical protein
MGRAQWSAKWFFDRELPGCADYGDQFLVCTFHMQRASLSLSIDVNSIDINTSLSTSVTQKGTIV